MDSTPANMVVGITQVDDRSAAGNDHGHTTGDGHYTQCHNKGGNTVPGNEIPIGKAKAQPSQESHAQGNYQGVVTGMGKRGCGYRGKGQDRSHGQVNTAGEYHQGHAHGDDAVN